MWNSNLGQWSAKYLSQFIFGSSGIPVKYQISTRLQSGEDENTHSLNPPHRPLSRAVRREARSSFPPTRLKSGANLIPNITGNIKEPG